MTELLEQAIARIREYPPEMQDDFARVLLNWAEDGRQPLYALTDEEEASLVASLDSAERGEFASNEEVEAVWAKVRP